tara:strand:- start:8271 stop:9212 length:942 start_codon:yes stop_codon:yes gene_type:complete
MSLNKQGKRIQIKNISPTPNTASSTFISYNKGQNINHNNSLIKGVSHPSPLLFGDKTSPTQFMDISSQKDPFTIWLKQNAITTITDGLGGGNSSTTTTTININSPQKTGGGDYLLRKGDTFYIYDIFTFNKKSLRCDADLLKTDTTITIASTSFHGHGDRFRSGSFIIYDNKTLTEIVSSSPRYLKLSIDNTTMTSLATSPVTLLGAGTGYLHIPERAVISFHYSDRETTDADLFIGWDTSATSTSSYWSKSSSWTYGWRDSGLSFLSAGEKNVVYSGFAGGIGETLYLYMDADLTTPTNTATLHLWYNTIVA